MKTKIAFWIAGCGTLTATVLRCIQMLFFFNYETGFVTDSGLFTALYCGTALLAVLAGGILCRLDPATCGKMGDKRSWGCGISTLLMSLFMLFGGVGVLWDAHIYKSCGVSYFVEPLLLSFHTPFAVLSLLFGLAALITAIAWLKGGKLPGRTGALWSLGILWGLCYMVLTFMSYSASATTEENLFTVCGGAAVVFFLLAEGKMISGVGGRKNSRLVYVFGLIASVFWLTYVLSNTILIIVGRGYATEMPYMVQLMMLMIILHALTLLRSLQMGNFIPAEESLERKNGARRGRKREKS